jgi:circadian clock protein KaiB
VTDASPYGDSPSPSDETRLEFDRLLAGAPVQDHYVLILFVTGSTLRSVQAISVIRSLCEKHLAGRYELEVVDIYQSPDRLAEEQILAAPTLLKKAPLPVQRLIGNLDDSERVLIGLNLKNPNLNNPKRLEV